jgi:hypothetical protein
MSAEPSIVLSIIEAFIHPREALHGLHQRAGQCILTA